MKRFIIILLLITLVFSYSIYAESLSWKCPYCEKTFYFDPRDKAYMDDFIARHLKACGGQGSTSRQTSSGRRSLPGYMFLGAAGGGTLGACYDLSASQPEIIRNAGFGAFCGGIFMGLLWVVDATISSAQQRDREWDLAYTPFSGDKPGIGITVHIDLHYL